MKSKEILKQITLLSGVSGNERLIKEYMQNQIGIDVPFVKDNLGSIAFELKGTSEKPRILVVGHLDEIGFMVHSITKNGLLRFINIGGWDPRTLMSSPVEVINHKGERFTGIIGSVPVHHLKDTSGKLSLDDMYIDLGADSDKEIIESFEIRKGDFVVPIPHYHFIDKKDIMISKAFDDRAGVALAIETAQYFKNKKHPNTIYCAGSAQEEVGTRGAQTIANLIKPDIAIVLEGSPGDDFPGNRDEIQCGMGKGLQMRVIDPTMLTNPAFKNLVIDVCEKYKIPYQIAVRKSGGTDAGKIHISNIGVPTVVLAVPVRYAHSHNCMMKMSDYQATLDLIIKLIETIDEKVLEKILP
ncbi:MAG TPA: M20/M25/M40 family metallo-hydrolase [Candidatus Cloacimonadota bacterium]|mgnify:FL=1|nr:M20/M25/M40 family metallo-hydrolase [Candidatus Cloacimonadota bacterium]HQB40213.1 M20/M25/M40 family metallo-hydrolase [Candidatus Cloacimonadota bacterium]